MFILLFHAHSISASRMLWTFTACENALRPFLCYSRVVCWSVDMFLLLDVVVDLLVLVLVLFLVIVCSC